MSENRWDNFFVGLAASGVFTIALYFFFTGVLRPFAEEHGKSVILFYPKAELYILVIDILLFRLFMIKLQKEEFAKGWLLSVFIFAMYFFYNYYHAGKI